MRNHTEDDEADTVLVFAEWVTARWQIRLTIPCSCRMLVIPSAMRICAKPISLRKKSTD